MGRNSNSLMVYDGISHMLIVVHGVSLIRRKDISKLENGTRNPSLKLLKRLADGMGMTLKLEFIPKNPVKN